MSFKGQNPNRAERKLYTGIANTVVQAINPDKAELEEMFNSELDKEPKYIDTNEEGVRRVRIDIYVRVANPDIPAMSKMAFFITEEQFIGSKTGKKQFINKFGRCTWASSIEAIDEETQYYDNVDSRPTFKGEEDLHKFLIAWINPKSPNKKKGEPGDPCRLEHPEKLFEGDFSELQDLVEAFSEHEFRPLWGVRSVVDNEGKTNYYQDIFTGKFDRAYSRSVQVDNWNKALGLGGEYPWKSDYQGVLDKFQEFNLEEAGQIESKSAPVKPSTTKGKVW